MIRYCPHNQKAECRALLLIFFEKFYEKVIQHFRDGGIIKIRGDIVGKIISAFAGVGKSYVGKKYSSVLDLESTYYKWLENGVAHLTEEERKGRKDRVLNPLWPQNYIDEILKQKDNYDIVLIQLSHKRLANEQIFEYFDKNKTEYCVARPNLSGWKFIEQRLRDRGNSEEFIGQVRDNFNVFIAEFSKPKYKQIIIEDGKFLEDALLKEGLLK